MIGEPINRVDGPAKVTGQATYTYEYWDVGEPLYGSIVGATIGRGQIKAIDASPAEQSPGVRMVLTYLNAPPQGARDTPPPNPRDPSIFLEYWRAQPAMASRDIHHYGAPVALVVATTLEQAQAAARLVDVVYTADAGHYDFAAQQHKSYTPKALQLGIPAASAVGDFDRGFNAAAVKFDRVYSVPFEFSQPMELHACLAVPRGDELTVYVSTQIVDAARAAIARTLQIDPKSIHIIAEYIGGGFGSKLVIHYETILAVMAARALNQPVKVSLTRQQVFHCVGVRQISSQRVRLGAGPDGRLVAIAHDVTMATNPVVEYGELTATTTRSLYAAPNRLTTSRLTPLDVVRGEDVRAPGEAPGMLVVETAMDELAHALGMDPIELRIRNEPTADPELGIPFSERRMVDCLRDGARRFGWERRQSRPASVRDGRWLVGYGVAAAMRAHPQAPAKVRVRIGRGGIALVQSDMTDIGTGTYTILAQVAAEVLGLPLERVRIELGHSDYPASWGSGGSWGASNATAALYRACQTLREKLLASTRTDARSPLAGRDAASAVFSNGRVTIGEASEALTDIVARLFPEGLEAEGETVFLFDDPNYKAYSIHTYGAHFAEVGVDMDTAEIRLRRMLGVFDAGRILNAKTARSQLIGAMTFGVGMALLEEGLFDNRYGAFVGQDLAFYLVPVHADIPAIDAVMLDSFDGKANVLGVKGLGELGICGAGAAIGNAVFNATGVRVRDFPITIDKVLPELSSTDL